MKKNLIMMAALWVSFLLFSSQVRAETITIEITGNVTSTSGSGLPATIHAGDTFTGIYTYESLTPDSNPSTKYVTYQHNSPYGISISLGGYEFKTAPNHIGQFLIGITNDDPMTPMGMADGFTVYSSENDFISSAGLTIDSIRWDLFDTSHMTFSSDTLPGVVPVLTDWNYNYLEIYGYNGTNNGFLIQGIVTQVIPEPVTDILMITGMFFLRRKW
jgi:hypothetical protein